MACSTGVLFLREVGMIREKGRHRGCRRALLGERDMPNAVAEYVGGCSCSKADNAIVQ